MPPITTNAPISPLLKPKAKWILILLAILYLSLFLFFVLVYEPPNGKGKPSADEIYHFHKGARASEYNSKDSYSSTGSNYKFSKYANNEDSQSSGVNSGDVSGSSKSYGNGNMATDPSIKESHLIAGTNETLPDSEQPEYEDSSTGTNSESSSFASSQDIHSHPKPLQNLPQKPETLLLEKKNTKSFTMENDLSDNDYETTSQGEMMTSSTGESQYLGNVELFNRELELPEVNEVHLNRRISRRGLFGLHLENSDERCVIPVGLWNDWDLLKGIDMQRYMQQREERDDRLSFQAHCPSTINSDDDVAHPQDHSSLSSQYISDTVTQQESTESFAKLIEKDDELLFWMHPQCKPLQFDAITDDILASYNSQLQELCRDVRTASRPPHLTMNRTLILDHNGASIDVFNLRTSNQETTHPQLYSECPILYLLRDQFTDAPKFDSYYVTHVPLKLNPSEQHAFVACGGLHSHTVQSDHLGLDAYSTETQLPESKANEQIVALPRFSSELTRISQISPATYKQKGKQQYTSPIAVHADAPETQSVPKQPEKTELSDAEEPIVDAASTPPNIVVVLLRSLSRVHFHRRMLKTIDFMHHKLQEYGYKSFEFFKYMSVGGHSANANLMPLFSGENWWAHCSDPWSCDTTKSIPASKFLWRRLQEKSNYKTASVSELSFVQQMASWRFNMEGWNHHFQFPLKDLHRGVAGGPHCFSGKKSYDYIFDYGSHFLETYKKDSKFLLTEFLQADEISMDVVADMDDSLTRFLEDTVSKHQNTYIVLVSDQGLNHGPFFDNRPSGKLEHKLPLLMLLTPPGLQKETLANLHHNQQKMMTAYDLYDTILDLGGITVTNKGKDMMHDSSHSITSSKLNENRDCFSMEAWIPKFMCICNLELDEVGTGYHSKEL